MTVRIVDAQSARLGFFTFAMPIKNDSITCINHPDIPMVRNSRPTVLHPVAMIDGQPAAMPTRGMFLSPFICRECGYVELYVVDKKQLTETWV